MKILIYAHSFPPYISGGAISTYELAKGLKKLGFEVTVMAPKYSEESSLFDKTQIFKIKRFFRKREFIALNILFGIVGLVIGLFKYKPELVLIPDLEAHIPSSIVRLLIPFKFFSITYGEETLVYNRGIKKYLFLFGISKSEHIITCSSYSKKGILSNSKINENRISVIYPGVDVANFRNHGDIQALRKKLGITTQKVLLTVARLVPHKGQDMVIKSLPGVIKNFPDIKYLIVGSGEDRKRLEEIVEKLNLQEYVLFTGEVNNEINNYYELCDIHIMLSREENNAVEGFGIVFLEANLMGKPVIGGNSGGIPEAIINGETGLIVNPCDHQQVAETITSLLENDDLCRRLGENGKRRVLAEFNWDHICKNVSSLIEREINST